MGINLNEVEYIWHLKSLLVDNKDVSLRSSHYCQSQLYKQSGLWKRERKKRKMDRSEAVKQN